MIRISLPYFWSLSEDMERIGSLKPQTKYPDCFVHLFSAQESLFTLLNNSVYSTALRSSRPHGVSLLKLLADQNKDDLEFEREIELHATVQITNTWKLFKTAFLAEMAVLPAYFVIQKAGYDTITLLEEADKIFPSGLKSKVPEALVDIAEAGKALCYELPTACGFHIYRAVEAVLRRYYTVATGGEAQPKVRNIGVYINALRQKKCADEKILSVLSQLSSLHRNPVIHPDVVLKLDEAIAVIGMAHSVIAAMLATLPDLESATKNLAEIS